MPPEKNEEEVGARLESNQRAHATSHRSGVKKSRKAFFQTPEGDCLGKALCSFLASASFLWAWIACWHVNANSGDSRVGIVMYSFLPALFIGLGYGFSAGVSLIQIIFDNNGAADRASGRAGGAWFNVICGVLLTPFLLNGCIFFWMLLSPS